MRQTIVYNLLIFLLFLLITFFSAVPYFSRGVLFNSHDLGFHLLRIEGLKESLVQGHIPTYINPTYMNGYGYPVDLFYPDFFLYIAVFFRMLGLSFITSYKLFVALVTLATLFISYISIKGLANSKYTGLIGSILYTLSSYRFADIYIRGALGETLAMTFLPLAAWGIYEILFRDDKKWWIATLGLSGIILSHVLTAYLFLLIIIITALFAGKRLWNEKRRLGKLILSGSFCFGICSFFLLPMIEQMVTSRINVQAAPTDLVEKHALSVMGLIEDSALNVMWGPNIGALFLFLPFTGLLVKRGTATKKMANRFLIGGLIFVFMTTNWFPWHYAQPLLGSIQFPFRLLTFASYSFAVACALYVSGLKQPSSVKFICTICASVLLSLSAYHGYFLEKQLQSPNLYYSEKNFSYNTFRIGAGKEYLPVDTSLSYIRKRGSRISVKGGKTEIGHYHKKGTTLSLTYNASKEAQLTLPLIYYKGYKGCIFRNGNEQSVDLKSGENHLITVSINGSGTLRVFYGGTTIQKLSGFISFLSLLGYLFFILLLSKPAYIKR